MQLRALCDLSGKKRKLRRFAASLQIHLTTTSAAFATIPTE